MLWNTRCKLINKACKVSNGFSSSYYESHSTKHLRMIHWLPFILSKKSVWDDEQQMTFSLIQSKLPNCVVMEKFKSHRVIQWDQNNCSPSCHMVTEDCAWENIQNCLQFRNQLLNSLHPHRFLDCFKTILTESMIAFSTTIWNLDVSSKTEKAFREHLNADILCSVAKAKSLPKNTHKIN